MDPVPGVGATDRGTLRRDARSERNRPEHFGRETRTTDADAWRDAIRSGFTGPSGKEPSEVAAMVVDAVRKNRFWVVSHSDLRPALEHRFAEILEATPYEP